jgi:hypothetical protein
MLAIADFSDDDGFAFPSTATLGKKLRMSERQTRRLLNQVLMPSGELRVRTGEGPHGTNLFQVCVTDGPEKIADGQDVPPDAGVLVPRTPTTARADTAMSAEPSLPVKEPSSRGDDSFEVAWKILPRRAGSNSKPAALRAWNARVRSGVKPAAMIAGAKRYYEFCEAMGKIGTEYVKQGSTFFGQDKHYETDFSLSQTPGQPQKPWYLTSSGIEAKGAEFGLLVPTEIREWHEFKHDVLRRAGVTPEMYKQVHALRIDPGNLRTPV